MKYDVETSRYKLQVEGPETIEEADRQAGKAGSALEEAVYSVIYRSWIPLFWKDFCGKLATLTGVARGVDADATAKAKSRAKDGNAKDVPEKWSAYDKRVWASVDEEMRKQITAAARDHAATIPVSFAPSKRGAGVDKKFLVKADSLLTMPEDELEAKITKYLETVPGFELERDDDSRPERESLARLVEQVFEALV